MCRCPACPDLKGKGAGGDCLAQRRGGRPASSHKAVTTQGKHRASDGKEGPRDERSRNGTGYRATGFRTGGKAINPSYLRGAEHANKSRPKDGRTHNRIGEEAVRERPAVPDRKPCGTPPVVPDRSRAGTPGCTGQKPCEDARLYRREAVSRGSRVPSPRPPPRRGEGGGGAGMEKLSCWLFARGNLPSSFVGAGLPSRRLSARAGRPSPTSHSE